MAGKSSYRRQRNRRKPAPNALGGINRANWIWVLMLQAASPTRFYFRTGQINALGEFVVDQTIIPEGQIRAESLQAVTLAAEEGEPITATDGYVADGEIVFEFGEPAAPEATMNINAERFGYTAADGRRGTDFSFITQTE